MGFPDVAYYYEAANLVNIIRTLEPNKAIDRIEIEMQAMNELTDIELFWNLATSRRKLNIKNTFLSSTLKIWDRWKPKLIGKIYPFTTFTNQKWFDSNLKSLFVNWEKLGINRLKDLTKNGEILLLEDRTQIKILCLRYFQLQTILSKKSLRMDLKKKLSYLEKLDLEDNSTKIKLSLTYKTIVNHDTESANTKIEKWDQDCDRQLTRLGGKYVTLIL